MRAIARSLITLFMAAPLAAADAPPVAPKPRLAAKKVSAVVTTSLPTAKAQIRQFAFDDNPDTYFESEKNAGKSDHFTLTLDVPVAIAAIQVHTGTPDGKHKLEAGFIEVSVDGKKYTPSASFKRGVAEASLMGQMVKYIRIRPGEDLSHPLVVREILVDSKPAVASFRHPVEVAIDASDAPDMKEWLETAAGICERQYGMICDELMSPGFKPLTVIHMTLKKDYDGVAYASGDRITGSVKYFKSHLNDFGAMVHETTHCIQRYRSRRNPGWLVEGVADYIRFFKFEPGKIGRLNVEQARYDGSYRITAAFLNYVSEKYDPQLVKKLNRAMREGAYEDGIWKEITGKPVEELNQEWRRSLVR